MVEDKNEAAMEMLCKCLSVKGKYVSPQSRI
jgi:hypothetical protein